MSKYVSACDSLRPGQLDWLISKIKETPKGNKINEKNINNNQSRESHKDFIKK